MDGSPSAHCCTPKTTPYRIDCAVTASQNRQNCSTYLGIPGAESRGLCYSQACPLPVCRYGRQAPWQTRAEVRVQSVRGATPFIRSSTRSFRGQRNKPEVVGVTCLPAEGAVAGRGLRHTATAWPPDVFVVASRRQPNWAANERRSAGSGLKGRWTRLGPPFVVSPSVL